MCMEHETKSKDVINQLLLSKGIPGVSFSLISCMKVDIAMHTTPRIFQVY